MSSYNPKVYTEQQNETSTEVSFLLYYSQRIDDYEKDYSYRSNDLYDIFVFGVLQK